jgi:hypothetical protein
LIALLLRETSRVQQLHLLEDSALSGITSSCTKPMVAT